MRGDLDSYFAVIVYRGFSWWLGWLFFNQMTPKLQQNEGYLCTQNYPSFKQIEPRVPILWALKQGVSCHPACRWEEDPLPTNEEAKENGSPLQLISKGGWLGALCSSPLQGSEWKSEMALPRELFQGSGFHYTNNPRFALPFQEITLLTQTSNFYSCLQLKNFIMHTPYRHVSSLGHEHNHAYVHTESSSSSRSKKKPRVLTKAFVSNLSSPSLQLRPPPSWG